MHDLDEEAARLAQRVLDGADGGDLAAQVEVEQLEAVEHVGLAQEAHRLDHLARRQAELASGRRPSASQRPAPLDASLTRMPMRGRTPIFLAVSAMSSSSENFSTTMITLRPSFEHMQRGLDVLLVLVAVADDERLLVVEDAP